MDVVYLVKNSLTNNSEELRYSLRSLKNIPHRNVIIAGEKPDWITNVIYIPVEQNDTKIANVKNNLMAAVHNADVSEDFIMMNDDFFIMKKIHAIPVLSFGPMQEIIKSYYRRYPEESLYMSTMKDAYQFLQDRGIEHPLSYELHVPMQFNKRKVSKLYNDIQMPTYHFRTFYGNFYNLQGAAVPDVKVFIEPEHNSPQYAANPLAYLNAQTFLSATGGSFSRGLVGEYIHTHLMEKSPYEL